MPKQVDINLKQSFQITFVSIRKGSTTKKMAHKYALNGMKTTIKRDIQDRIDVTY